MSQEQLEDSSSERFYLIFRLPIKLSNISLWLGTCPLLLIKKKRKKRNKGREQGPNSVTILFWLVLKFYNTTDSTYNPMLSPCFLLFALIDKIERLKYCNIS